MNVYSSNVQKNLNRNIDYTLVLQQIGIHSQPINRYKIMNGLSKSTYVYYIMDELCPSTFTPDRFVLKWNDIDNRNKDSNYKRKLLLKIKYLYKMDWKVPKADDQLNINYLIRFKKSRDRKLCWINHDTDNVIGIGLINSAEKEEAKIIVLDGGIKKELVDDWLIVKRSKRKSKLSLYTRKRNPQSRWYLDVIMSEKARTQNNPIIERYWEFIKYFHMINHRNRIPANILEEIIGNSSCMNIINNKEYWEYRLNFRGLLLYLIGEPKLERRSNIREILSNILTLEIAPFLMYWLHLEKMGFDVIEVLRRIAQQFQAQIDLTLYDDSYLMRTIAERYFIEVEYFFNPVNLAIHRNAWIQELGIEKTSEFLLKLFEYRLFMLHHLKRWTTLRLKEINSNYRIYYEDYRRYRSEGSYEIGFPPPSPPYVEETDDNYLT